MMAFDSSYKSLLQEEMEIAIGVVRKLGLPTSGLTKHLDLHRKSSARWDILMIAIRAARMKLYDPLSKDAVNAEDIIAKSGWAHYLEQ